MATWDLLDYHYAQAPRFRYINPRLPLWLIVIYRLHFVMILWFSVGCYVVCFFISTVNVNVMRLGFMQVITLPVYPHCIFKTGEADDSYFTHTTGSSIKAWPGCTLVNVYLACCSCPPRHTRTAVAINLILQYMWKRELTGVSFLDLIPS